MAKFLREFLPYLGPAFLVSVGYMDPGNWGTDIVGGSQFGYQLLWVILLSNGMAILLQSLSVKLGIATGKTLPQNCRAHFSRPVNLGLWVTAELAAMATDLAEFLGAALGFYLLFGIPMIAAALLAGVLVMLTLGLYRYGFRVVEYVILGYVSIIGLAYLFEIVLVKPDWGQIVSRTFVPSWNSQSLLVAVGILGATVMPHNIYLHSGLIQSRIVPGNGPMNRKLLRFAVLDGVFALNMAWLINSAILIMAAAAFHNQGLHIASIEEAHRTLTPLLGGLASLAFAVALLCSGLSSSTTATLAGQIIVEGFLNVKIPLWLRRLVTMIPALVVIALSVDPLMVLVISQAFLSLQLPFAIVPLVFFTARRGTMGEYVNRPATTIVAVLVTATIVSLNLLLLYQALGGRL